MWPMYRRPPSRFFPEGGGTSVHRLEIMKDVSFTSKRFAVTKTKYKKRNVL